MASRKNDRDPSFSIRVDLHGDGPEVEQLCERINAQCWDAGAAGMEERSESGGLSLIIYTRKDAIDDVCEALRREMSGAGERRGEVGQPERVDDEDWSETWKHGLEPIEVSPRLVVRPSFEAFELGRGQQEIIIDPGQAFGTGGHESTLLALEWLDALADGFDARTRVLDVGTGTGVLAFAALRLGAGSAVGFDLDPIAVHEARIWAERNDLQTSFSAFAGGIEALQGRCFDLIVANLLRTELMPLIPDIAQRTTVGGEIVLSGLLTAERDSVARSFENEAVVLEDVLERRDASGADWISLLLRRCD
jgi:ribosomal protein L11 methyltransferase